MPPKYLPELLESLREIVWESPKTRVFLTRRSHVGEATQRYFTQAVMMHINPNTNDIRNYLFKFCLFFLVSFIRLQCISLLSLCFGYACPRLTLLQLRTIFWCFIVYFRVISEDLTCGFLSGIQDLRLFMHLLCTTVGHDISNNLLTPSWIHAHYLGFTWKVFWVKHVPPYVLYIVFPIFISLIWGRTFV